MGSQLTDIEDVRAYFAHDRFATEALGCEVEEARPGHAVCAFDVDARHRNAQGAVMGGAIFTLADFALAVASNVGGSATVTLTSTIEFMSATRGTRLFARADADREGGTVGFYTVTVTDDLGCDVARMCATCYVRRERA